MSDRRVSKIAPSIAILGLAGLMTAALTGCKSSSPAPSASPKQAASARPSVAKKTPIVGSAAKGKELFQENCTTCHGMQGQGVPHLGADLETNKFIAHSSDAQVVTFIEEGRSANDPLNTMHVAMPPKGGDPAVTTQDIYDIVAFLRQIQKTGNHK